MRISILAAALAVLAGCGRAAPGHPAGPAEANEPAGVPVLRAVYRDATHRLLVALPDHHHAVPRGDCGAALLIDDGGGVRQISAAEAMRWMTRLQLTGAVQGRCPAPASGLAREFSRSSRPGSRTGSPGFVPTPIVGQNHRSGR